MLNSSKQHETNSLYVAGASFGIEDMVHHCLWKLLSETGFIHLEELTEVEVVVLSRLLKNNGASNGSSSTGDSTYAMAVLNRAIDKVVCKIKLLQVESQKYQSALSDNRRLRKKFGDVQRVAEHHDKGSASLTLNRSINDVGLSKRVTRILESIGIDTLEKLRSCSLSDLQKQQRIGVKAIHDIEITIAKYASYASQDR